MLGETLNLGNFLEDSWEIQIVKVNLKSDKKYETRFTKDANVCLENRFSDTFLTLFLLFVRSMKRTTIVPAQRLQFCMTF
jgi:hypothetical protein